MINSSSLLFALCRHTMLAQVANFVGDADGVQCGASHVAQLILTALADGACAFPETHLAALLDLSSELLGTILRACAARWPIRQLLMRLPFLLHSALLQLRMQPVHGGNLLALNDAAQHRDDLHAKPPCTADDNALEPPAVTALCAQLVPLRNLVAVDLSAVLLDAQQLAAVTQALRLHSQLTYLVLGECDAALIGSRVLADALPRWPCLQHFEVFDPCWTWAGSCDGAQAATLLRGVQALMALTRLSLPGLRATDGGLNSALASLQALRCLHLGNESTLVGKSVSHCQIEPLPMEAVQRLQHLTQLSLAGRWWYSFPPPFCASLRTLNLSRSVGVRASERHAAVSGLSHLQDLKVDGMLYRGPGFSRFESFDPEALHGLAGLTRLSVGDLLTDSWSQHSLDAKAPQLCAAVSRLTCLRELRVQKLLVCDHLTQAMSPAWRCLPQLRSLQFHISYGEALFPVSTGADAEPADSQPPLLELEHLTLVLWVKPDPEADDFVEFDDVGLTEQLLRLTGLRTLVLCTNATRGAPEHSWPYGEQLLSGIAVFTQLQALRMGLADLTNCQGLHLLPEAASALTLLELRKCVVPSTFIERLSMAKLVHLTLDVCRTSDSMLDVLVTFIHAHTQLPASLRALELTNMPSGLRPEALSSFLEVVGASAVRYVSLEGTVLLPCVAPCIDRLSALCAQFNQQFDGEKHCAHSFEERWHM